MSAYEKLKRPPVQEAILDFRVKLPSAFNVEAFQLLHPQFSPEYPKIKERRTVQHRIHAEEEGLSSYNRESLGVQGFTFLSADEKDLVQFRKDGFTYNRLAPYTSWEAVFTEASRFWRIYCSTTNPEEVSRVAVRYINRLRLPQPVKEFGEYFTAHPTTPAASQTIITGFVSRVTVYNPASRLKAHIIQALESPSDLGFIPVLLDIDVFDEELTSFGPIEVLSRFQDLRNLKNELFFKSITAKAKELFE